MTTKPTDERRGVITVTPRQVEAAKIAITGYQKLGREVPPGLRKIAEAKPDRTSPEQVA